MKNTYKINLLKSISNVTSTDCRNAIFKATTYSFLIWLLVMNFILILMITSNDYSYSYKALHIHSLFCYSVICLLRLIDTIMHLRNADRHTISQRLISESVFIFSCGIYSFLIPKMIFQLFDIIFNFKERSEDLILIFVEWMMIYLISNTIRIVMKLIHSETSNKYKEILENETV